MAATRRLVIDVLKPHDPPLLEFTDRLADLECVEGVSASLIELDQEVQNVKVTVEGADLGFETLEDAVEGLSGTIHSVDQVVCGERLVEERRTLQDD